MHSKRTHPGKPGGHLRRFVLVSAIATLPVIGVSWAQVMAQKDGETHDELSAQACRRPRHYTITELKGLPGSHQSAALAINNRGEVAGWSDTADNETHAVLWRKRDVIDLGTLSSGTYRSAIGTAINNEGDVAGGSSTTAGEQHAFLWHEGKMIDLGTQGQSSFAFGINDCGQVVGRGDFATATRHAFLWENGQMIDLGTLGGSTSVANAINNKHQVVGAADTSGGNMALASHAFIWQDGTMTDLGTLGGMLSAASAINQRSEVAGSAAFSPQPGQPGAPIFHAFVWKNGKMTDLGIPSQNGNDFQSSASGINERGLILGNSETPASNHRPVPALWHKDQLIDLTGLILDLDGWVLNSATGINNRNQIVGNGSYNGKAVGFLLTPSEERLDEATE